MFENYLKSRLKELKIDVGIYLSYITGILEDNIDLEEKRETLADIISSMIDPNEAEKFINEIFEKWDETHDTPSVKPKNTAQEKIDLAKMLESTTLTSQKSSYQNQRQLTEEEKRIKEQILANYSQTEFKDENLAEEDDETAGAGIEDDTLEKNTNKADVQKLAKEKREQARIESQQKKQKDKEDRAKQKAKQDEKKANRKAAAVKGERRR